MSDRAKELRRRQLAARIAAASQTDDMGFPIPPKGGVSTNSQAVDEFSTKGGAAFDGLVQGASFGIQDEFAGVNNAIFGGRAPGDTMGERYASGRDAQRNQNSVSQAAEPVAFGGGQLVGAAIPAIATAGAGTGATPLGTAMRSGGLGAVEGALHGVGTGEGLKDRAGRGVKGAVIGGGVGVAAPALVAAGRMAKSPLTGMMDSAINRASKGKASKAITDALMSGGRNADDVGKSLMQAAQEGQPEYRMMDALGVAGQRQASGVARSGGDASTEIAEFLTQRQQGQGDRVGGFVDDAFGTAGTTAKKTVDDLTSQRSTTANAAYDAARGNAAPVDVRGALSVIDQRIGGMQGSNVVGDSIDGKLAGYRSRLAADTPPSGEVSRELSDFDRVLGVKQSIQDDIGAAVRAGRKNEARELGKLMGELDSSLEASSDMYRAANDGFRDASRVIDSVDQGAQMAKPGRSADNVPAFQRMTPEQQGAARIGYGDNMLEKLERVNAPTTNRAKALQSPKRDAEAAAMTVDPNQYSQRLQRENEMWETQNRALGGSRTADNQADQAGTESLAGGAISAARSGGNFQLGDAAAKIAGMLAPFANGKNEATRKLIGEALMSRDMSVITPLLERGVKDKKMRRTIEALMRQPLREGLSQQ